MRFVSFIDPPQFGHLGPAQILKLAATPDWQYWRMSYDALGYDSALEAFEAGVPMDDILV